MKHIQTKEIRKILTPASGFLSGYTHTLNPYSGCAYSCSYCYVRSFPHAIFRGEPWGSWVDIKANAPEQLQKELRNAKKKGPVTIFMSSSTDPYQPSEHQHEITKRILEVFAENPPDFLFLQTRSPLVRRDLPLLEKLRDRIRVSITVETDLEDVRKRFTPEAPPIPARLRVLKELTNAGIPTQAAVSPLLPSSDFFPAKLAGVTGRVVIDDYYMGDGAQGRRTKKLHMEQYYTEEELDRWFHPEAYLRFRESCLKHFSAENVKISQEGFLPG
ncbi:SPL family radical SAM protein [Marinicrinis lubricantis]|uniref:Radical SAM protein n=1 Tax=Marinicrinis lubricantis TaxID=2086470 RepID=A0ABW1ITK4_9BACL